MLYRLRNSSARVFALLSFIILAPFAQAQQSLFNVSYDVWKKAQKIHFDDGGLFDQIYVARQ